MQTTIAIFIITTKSLHIVYIVYVTGPAKTGHICTILKIVFFKLNTIYIRMSKNILAKFWAYTRLHHGIITL